MPWFHSRTEHKDAILGLGMAAARERKGLPAGTHLTKVATNTGVKRRSIFMHMFKIKIHTQKNHDEQNIIVLNKGMAGMLGQGSPAQHWPGGLASFLLLHGR